MAGRRPEQGSSPRLCIYGPPERRLFGARLGGPGGCGLDQLGQLGARTRAGAVLGTQPEPLVGKESPEEPSHGGRPGWWFPAPPKGRGAGWPAVGLFTPISSAACEGARLPRPASLTPE
ncbi:hypothetical protein Vau01_066590 [Virgisporangium aurantiacum]|uniref:Uncharacterized protein n=1 Tax=Virgisporangium aurantiacum TaxID=175570 RepID=A0A8J4E2Q8_9ACTN|nr:hypothetical protein Vau01_066590 [Virgisporangium aurantiacum]